MSRSEDTQAAVLGQSKGPALSRATLIGRLTSDPQLNHTKSGRAVSTLRLAVNDGAEPSFHDVVVWGRTAEVVAQYMRKGRLIHVEGKLRNRTWQAQDGSKRRTTEVVASRVQFLSRGQAEEQA